MHASPRLFPWVFTLYICWSPWHYSGQNYGLLMMFASAAGPRSRRRETHWLRGAFIASYCMLLGSFVTGGSDDPLIFSPDCRRSSLSLAPGAWACVYHFHFPGIPADGSRAGRGAMIAPLTLAFTQFLVVCAADAAGIELQFAGSANAIQQRDSRGPAFRSIHLDHQLFPAPRSAGGRKDELARCHLFRHAACRGHRPVHSRSVAGELHFPLRFHYQLSDFCLAREYSSFHSGREVLEAARFAGLVAFGGNRCRSVAICGGFKRAVHECHCAATSVFAACVHSAGVPVFCVGLLFLWGGFDQFHFAMRTSEGNLPLLLRAASLNPYDSSVQARIATAAGFAGHKGQAAAAFERAVEINPSNVGIATCRARALIEDGRYADAYAHYQKMLDTLSARFRRAGQLWFARRAARPSRRSHRFLGKGGGSKSAAGKRAPLSGGAYDERSEFAAGRAPLERVYHLRSRAS